MKRPPLHVTDSAPSACPPKRQLQQLLEDIDLSAIAPDLLAHIETCRACHAVMEELTALGVIAAGPESSSELSSPAAPSRAVFRTRLSDDHLRRLRSLLSSVNAVSPSDDGGGAEDINANDLRANDLSADDVSAEAASPSNWPVVQGYEMIRELGRGGMAVVYEARHLRLNRPVALKMIRGHSATAEQIVRFGAEAEIIAGLRHPNIVQIYEVGTQAAQPYFALELMEGGTLADALRGKPAAARCRPAG